VFRWRCAVIMMVPCKLAVIDLFFDKNEARQEASPAEFYGVTLGLNILALLVACSVSDLSIVLSLNGAVCTNLVAFVLPMMLYLKARKGGPGGVNIFSTSNTASLGLLVFGVFSLCVGTYQVIGSMAS
jgi:amino acid permease